MGRKKKGKKKKRLNTKSVRPVDNISMALPKPLFSTNYRHRRTIVIDELSPSTNCQFDDESIVKTSVEPLAADTAGEGGGGSEGWEASDTCISNLRRPGRRHHTVTEIGPRPFHAGTRFAWKCFNVFCGLFARNLPHSEHRFPALTFLQGRMS